MLGRIILSGIAVVAVLAICAIFHASDFMAGSLSASTFWVTFNARRQ